MLIIYIVLVVAFALGKLIIARGKQVEERGEETMMSERGEGSDLILSCSIQSVWWKIVFN